MGNAADTFWKFSLGFYSRSEVAAACLALQDHRGRDVNMVLYACWVGLSGRGRLAASDYTRAEQVVAPWRRATIEPMRAARRALKDGGQQGKRELYAAAKAVELAAEQVAQRHLAAFAPEPSLRSTSERVADAEANLLLYLENEAARDVASPILAALAEMED